MPFNYSDIRSFFHHLNSGELNYNFLTECLQKQANLRELFVIFS